MDYLLVFFMTILKQQFDINHKTIEGGICLAEMRKLG